MRKQCPRCSKQIVQSTDEFLQCDSCGYKAGLSPETTADWHTQPAAGDGGSIDVSRPGDQTVGNYRLLRELGAGGMGVVYEAEDGRSGRHVALKLINSKRADSPDALDRFRREGLLASRIVHPRSVFVFEVGEDQGCPYIVMEVMPGKTLKTLVQSDGTLSPEKAVVTILDVIEGLSAAHRLGVIHRDVKPSNCYLDRKATTEGRAFAL